jgi:AraC family transcriptional regulator
MKEETRNNYAERINKILMYIDNNLDEKLDLNTLAGISNFSPYHFHRIITAYLNESIGAYILRKRLEISATILRHSERPVSDIAYSVGYDTPSSFTKAFKNRFGITPIDFRKNKESIELNHDKPLLNLKNAVMKIDAKYKELQPQKVLYISHIGDYNDVGIVWERLCKYAGMKNLMYEGQQVIGISHDDPNVTDQSKLRYDACLTLKQDVKPEGEVGVKEIPGGKYAVVTHKGPYKNLINTYNALFGNYIPKNEVKLRDCPIFELYVNDPEKVKEEDILTEIYIPVE